MRRIILSLHVIYLISFLLSACANSPLHVASDPSGAKVYFCEIIEQLFLSDRIDCDYKCTTPCIVKKYVTKINDGPLEEDTFAPPRRKYRFIAKKEGYYDSGYIGVSSSDDTLHFSLKSLPKISFDLLTTPEDADVYLGEIKEELILVGKTPYTQETTDKCWPLKYYQVKKEGYWDSEIFEQKEICENVSKTMKLYSKTESSLLIRSVPNGADILISTDGTTFKNLSLKTPQKIKVNFKQKKPKAYFGKNLKVRKKGFFDSDVYTVEPSRQVIEHVFKLEKLKFGYIKLTANESNVDIFLDGELKGQIHKEKPFVKRISIGSHLLTVKKKFFKTESIKLSLDENEVFVYNFELINSPGWKEDTPGHSKVIQAKGNLTILTEHNDYIVYVDGVKKIPPFALKNIAASNYEIKIVSPQGEKNISATVEDGENVIIDLDKILSR